MSNLQKLKQELSDLGAYLSSTDYLIIREADAGTLCPQEVRQARAAARVRINEIKSELEKV